MTLEDAVWYIALGGMGLVAAVFIHVVIQAGRAADEAATRQSAHTAEVLRRWLFGVLLLIFLVGSWATLHRFPIPVQRGPLAAKQVVDVLGGQWYWTLSVDTVRTGSPVEFRVTSADVNHGFAIYTPSGHIVTQTQAMPGYTNKVLYTFTQPGTYTVQCLEYCGLGHAPMNTTFQVVTAGGE